jgi:hypothetical protein
MCSHTQGIAAVNVGGVTIHSFAGIGLGVGDSQSIVQKIQANKNKSKVYLDTKVLVIDEVSSWILVSHHQMRRLFCQPLRVAELERDGLVLIT